MSGLDQPNAARAAWARALAVARLLAVDPVGLGGAAIHAHAGPVRERWLGYLRASLPPETPWRRLPVSIGDERLLGGLDLTASLDAGRPVLERGLLAEADGGIALLAMAERLPSRTAARLGAAIDRGAVQVERDGLAVATPTRFGIVALDESAAGEAPPPAALLDRLGFHLDLADLPMGAADAIRPEPSAILAARARLGDLPPDEEACAALVTAAFELGIISLRAPLLALAAARAATALAGRSRPTVDDLALAAGLVLGPRATRLPAGAEAATESPPPPEPANEPPPEPLSEPAPTDDEGEGAAGDVAAISDIVLAAAAAAIPSGLLAQLRGAPLPGGRGAGAGRDGASSRSSRRGRPAGTRPGQPGPRARLDLVATLRAAAPWQRLRQRHVMVPGDDRRIVVRRDDFRIRRFHEPDRTTTIFAVDASGSAAMHRLAEAKGAVELLLADCYVRRDRVALLAFRGAAAELVLPPTRSLARAKRSLAGLPGGGGTPLAAAIEAAMLLADAVRRRGETPLLVLLTDGRANVARDGTRARAEGQADALRAARLARATGLAGLLVDTSRQPQPVARELAQALSAHYLPLPQADARLLSAAVRQLQPNAS